MKLLLANTLKNRNHQTTKDARLLNCIVDVKGERKQVFKRPAIVETFAAMEAGDGWGRLLFSFSTPAGVETLVAIQNDVLNNSPTPVAKKLAFSTQPVNWKIATAMSPSVVVSVTDSFGNVMTGTAGTVTMSLSSGPSGGALSGTTSVALSGGYATFSNLKFNNVGGGYKLRASMSGVSGKVSSVFKIISELSFTVQPSTTAPGATISVPEVSVVDSSGGVIAGYVGNVTVALGSNPASGTLSGTLTVAAVSGVASFTNLSIDNEGNGYTLVASADTGNLVNKASASFNIVDFTHTLVSADFLGEFYGFQDGIDGSVTPTTISILGGAAITTLGTNVIEAPAGDTILLVTGSFTQNAFTSLTMNGVTLLTSNADGFLQGATTRWRWSSPANLLTATGTYLVTIA